MSIVKKTIIASALAATALVTTTPAMARDRYHGHDNTAAVAIGAGVIGLALGAIIASSNHDNDRYRDRTYYDSNYYGGPAYTTGWYYRDGYYWDRDGHRYDRDAYNRYRQGDDYRRGYRHDRDDNRRGY